MRALFKVAASRDANSTVRHVMLLRRVTHHGGKDLAACYPSYCFPPSRCLRAHTGTFVRIAPNHLSIADPDALQIVYGHGTGTLKSDFYDAFVSIQRGLFNTRSRLQHARKRKIVSHIFSQKNVLEFEPHVRAHLVALFKQWDKLCDGGLKGDRKSTRLNSSHSGESRMPSSA